VSKHTAGPWVALGNGVFTDDSAPQMREILHSIYNTRSASKEEQRANALLIAAAPEMLEALCEILRCVANGSYGADGCSGMTMAREAVERAMGDL
jgi:hypothetical protein